jgi:hypothetical protein
MSDAQLHFGTNRHTAGELPRPLVVNFAMTQQGSSLPSSFLELSANTNNPPPPTKNKKNK